ncbi:MAG: hypothetical protein ACRDEA_04340 [Microcystaceae cyanobacterium]
MYNPGQVIVSHQEYIDERDNPNSYASLLWRGGIDVVPIAGNLSEAQKTRLSHPHYWAPFILIGNGL